MGLPPPTEGAPFDGAALREAHARLARELHPASNPSRVAAIARKRMVEAYAVLSDAAKRSEYDASLITPAKERPSWVAEKRAPLLSERRQLLSSRSTGRRRRRAQNPNPYPNPSTSPNTNRNPTPNQVPPCASIPTRVASPAATVASLTTAPPHLPRSGGGSGSGGGGGGGSGSCRRLERRRRQARGSARHAVAVPDTSRAEHLTDGLRRGCLDRGPRRREATRRRGTKRRDDGRGASPAGESQQRGQ